MPSVAATIAAGLSNFLSRTPKVLYRLAGTRGNSPITCSTICRSQTDTEKLRGQMSISLPSSRNLNSLIIFGCVFMMTVALIIFEWLLQMAPCPMCIFQRIAVITVGFVAAIAALHNPGLTGTRVYGVLTVLAAIAGGAVSGRHIWLQGLPEDLVPACGPGLDYLMDVFPLTDVVSMVLMGDGSCAEINWSFLGMSLPGWTLVGFIGLACLGSLQILRRA